MNGIINLKKEAGMTSHDAVFKLRKILGTKKIGHGGTLDPWSQKPLFCLSWMKSLLMKRLLA
ncbi:tRNA pseudouridine synthase B [Streptococcus pneumoniae]|nr:tRNA pseudouridine synthase B [Streptococcus pneumoniae]